MADLGSWKVVVSRSEIPVVDKERFLITHPGQPAARARWLSCCSDGEANVRISSLHSAGRYVGSSVVAACVRLASPSLWLRQVNFVLWMMMIMMMMIESINNNEEEDNTKESS